MTGRNGTDPGCGRHATLGAELRAVAVLLLDRVGPALEHARSAGPAQSAAVCATCPVCAVLALLRGERPELAVRLAEQASGLLDALAAALQEGPGPDRTGPDEPVRDQAGSDGFGSDGFGSDGPGSDRGREARPQRCTTLGTTPDGRRVQRIPVDRPSPVP